MKLTEAQHIHLMNLAICTDYQCKETAALVGHGLAAIGKSRYGEWANITAKGRALVMSLPMPERVRLEGEVINSKMPASATAARYSAESCPVTAKQRTKRVHLVTPSTRPNGAAASGATLLTGAAVQNRAQPESTRKHSVAHSTAAPTSPNAVRIIVGQRATYYPVSMLKSISHVSKQVVCTTNPFYKPIPLEASERNDRVL